MENTGSFVFSEKDLFRIFASVDAKEKKVAHEKDYYEGVNSKLPESCWLPYNHMPELNASIKKYKRKKKKKMSTSMIVQEATSDKILKVELPFLDPPSGPSTLEDESPPLPKKSRGPEEFSTSFSKSYKDFHDLSDKQKRNITAPLVDMLNSFIETNKFSLDTNQLLGYLLVRDNIQSKKAIAEIGQKIYSGLLKDKKSFSIVEAVLLMHSLVLSKEQTRKVRQFLSIKDIEFPTTNSMLPVRKSLRPDTSSVFEGKGHGVDYTDIVSDAITSILKYHIKLATNIKITP